MTLGNITGYKNPTCSHYILYEDESDLKEIAEEGRSAEFCLHTL